MKINYTVGLDAKQSKEAKEDFDGSASFRLRLKEVLEKKIDEKLASRRGTANYDSPSWSLLQADGIGYEKALLEVISLIT